MPTTEQEWLEIAEDYEAQWNFPHCLGAIDGRLCLTQAPLQSGRDNFTYKQNFTIVLLGVVDSNYCFLFADCQQERIIDKVIEKTTFWEKLQKNELNLPAEDVLPERQTEIPYVFLDDDAFDLHENLIKPYPDEHKKNFKKDIFNYRFCRARRIIENIFGIMSTIFGVLTKKILLSPEKASTVTLTCVYLHNFLMKSDHSRNIYIPPGTFDEDEDGNITLGSWRQATVDRRESFIPLNKIGETYSATCNAIRNEFAEYFMHEAH